ncbi:branched-chain alpha-ketoacid dehydrogenase kinase [Cladorrhinum sp. PSN332]|nr:branched-chain alpha-ketoacid dehydrogenase kinase [Cladorrhinum sp. PSN332]
MAPLSLQHVAASVRLMSRPNVTGRGLCRLGQYGVAARGQLPNQRQTRPLHSDGRPKWRPVSVLDEWVAREARPISLRQLMVFGRSLTESRLISSANYVRTELPVRIAHRIRDMQQLPYVVTTNPHFNQVYDLYYTAFDAFRKIREIKTLEDNDRFCTTIRGMLKAHLTVIPTLARGILECTGLMGAAELDKFMNTILRSRISRRVIAEQHLALTDTFHAPWFSPGARLSETEVIGHVFLKCIAKDVITKCGDTVLKILRHAYGPDVILPEIQIDGHLEASFPYILSHLQYIVGELLRNSVQSVAEQHLRRNGKNTDKKPPPIQVTVCESNQHVIIRISDQGGGIPREILPYLWSFSKGPASQEILSNLTQVPKMAATMQELRQVDEPHAAFNDNPTEAEKQGKESVGSDGNGNGNRNGSALDGTDLTSSLASLSKRPPNLRLGMALPLCRVYAEYWAGSLSLHSLEGYGVDAFLQISKLGNKNEQLTTRATMDAV